MQDAIPLAETLQDWSNAISLCNELARLYPPLSAKYLEKARNLAAKQLNGVGKN